MKNKPQSVSPLEEAIDVINRLIDLCSRHGLEQEAKRIAAGTKTEEPPRRGPGAPATRGKEFQKLVAVLLAENSDGQPTKRGEKARLARRLAEAELKAENIGRRINEKERTQKTSTLQNVISATPPQYQMLAAFLVRRTRKGDSVEHINKIIEGVKNGDESAKAAFTNEIQDLAALGRKIKRIDPKSESHEN